MTATDGKRGSGERASWSDERVLWRSRPGAHVVLPPVVVGAVLVVVGLWLPGAVDLPNEQVPLLLVPVGTLLAAVWALYWWRTVHVVTETRLFRRGGILGRELAEVPLSEVTAVGHVRSGLDRLAGAGTVEVSVRKAKGEGEPDGNGDGGPGLDRMAMEHVRRPEHLDDLLTELCLDPGTPSVPGTAAATAEPADGEATAGPDAAPEPEPRSGSAARTAVDAAPADEREGPPTGASDDGTGVSTADDSDGLWEALIDDSGGEAGSPVEESGFVFGETGSGTDGVDGNTATDASGEGTRDGRRDPVGKGDGSRIDVQVVDADGVTLLKVLDDEGLPGVSPGDEVRLSLARERERR